MTQRPKALYSSRVVPNLVGLGPCPVNENLWSWGPISSKLSIRGDLSVKIYIQLLAIKT